MCGVHESKIIARKAEPTLSSRETQRLSTTTPHPWRVEKERLVISLRDSRVPVRKMESRMPAVENKYNLRPIKEQGENYSQEPSIQRRIQGGSRCPWTPLSSQRGVPDPYSKNLKKMNKIKNKTLAIVLQA